jgi:ubiquinone/menaquinone biosynthesis C-methylase UbiE
MEYNYGNFEANKKFLETQKINWKGKKVLEIGCGNGTMTEYLFDNGADIIAVDISATFLETAKKRFGKRLENVFKKMSGDKLQFEDNTFDVVVSFDLIEHVPNVSKHFQEVNRVLKSNGMYFFQTPNKVPSALFAMYRYKHLTKYKENHPSLQTKNSLKKLTNVCGFRIDFPKVNYYTQWYRNKLPKILRYINPQKLGLETNIYAIAKKKNGKKILDIVTTPYLIPKGSSLRVDSVLKKLSKNNEVDLLVYPVGKDPVYENVKTFRVLGKSNIKLGVSEISLKKIFLDILILFKAFSLMFKNKYDIVHCEDFEAAFVGSVLSVFFRRPRYVYDLHNTIVDNLKITNKPKVLINIFKVLSKFVYSRFNLIIANWKIYEGIGKKTFLLYDESNIEIEKTDIPTKKKYLAYSGNFKKYQGVKEFVKVYTRVKPDFDLVLVGEPTEDIKEFVDDSGLKNSIHFTGVLDIKKSNYILSNAEFCLIPRTSGKQPGLKMIHHIMLGKVSLATDIPANTEILKDGYNSVLYSSDQELEKILKDIDSGKVKGSSFEKGIKEAQKEIEEIWSQEYFDKHYYEK